MFELPDDVGVEPEDAKLVSAHHPTQQLHMEDFVIEGKSFVYRVHYGKHKPYQQLIDKTHRNDARSHIAFLQKSEDHEEAEVQGS